MRLFFGHEAPTRRVMYKFGNKHAKNSSHRAACLTLAKLCSSGFGGMALGDLIC
jgi:hypothetical protein